MKGISWLLTSEETRRGKGKKFLLSPFISVRSLNRPSTKQPPIKTFVIFFPLFLLFIYFFQVKMNPLSNFEVMLFTPVVYFFGEGMGALAQIIFPTPTFPVHVSPLTSSSLSNFWGRDWNVWIQDWFKDISLRLKKGNQTQKIFMIFIVSGLFHEVMCTIPYWIYFRKSYIGTMLAYFLIQGIGLWVDKKFIVHLPKKFRRIYLWVVVILPSPLFINVPLLTFFGLTHE